MAIKMFNLLITSDEHAWETDSRMSMYRERFGEHSGDEREVISLSDIKSVKMLEQVQTLLMYEEFSVADSSGEVVRVGQLRDIRVGSSEITFRFTESGRLRRSELLAQRHRLQIGQYESNRTHWAIKDGEIPQDIIAAVVETPRSYDIVLSFAGEDREYVSRVAEYLAEHDVDFFYDEYEEFTLWGKDLVEHLDTVYRKAGRYCVMFLSKHYADKMWPSHERRSALSRAMEQKQEYVLPARFDSTDIPGIRPTIGYVDLSKKTPQEFGRLILLKLGRG